MKRCKRTLMLVSLWNQCWSLNDTLKYPLFLDVLMFSLITICFLSLHFVLNYAVQARTNQLEKDYKEKEGTVNHSFCAVCMMLWFSFLYIFLFCFCWLFLSCEVELCRKLQFQYDKSEQDFERYTVHMK